MMKLHPKYFSGIVAVAVYFGIIGLVFFYFGYRHETRSTHFVTKNTHAIAVTLQAPTKAKSPAAKTVKPKTKPKPKTKKKHHSKPKPIQSPQKTHVKPVPRKTRKRPAKKIKAKKLFSQVKTTPKNTPKPKKNPSIKPRKTATKAKSSQSTRDSLKRQQERDKGIENRYLAGVQEKLYGWPTQTSFAGARVTIGLTIHPSGRFDYVVLQHSNNPDFDRTILQYLKQLQSMGFDPTPKGKKYAFKVDIVAK